MKIMPMESVSRPALEKNLASPLRLIPAVITSTYYHTHRPT